MRFSRFLAPTRRLDCCPSYLLRCVWTTTLALASSTMKLNMYDCERKVGLYGRVSGVFKYPEERPLEAQGCSESSWLFCRSSIHPLRYALILLEVVHVLYDVVKPGSKYLHDKVLDAVREKNAAITAILLPMLVLFVLFNVCTLFFVWLPYIQHKQSVVRPQSLISR